MSEPEVQPEERISPIDNLSGWLDAKTRDAEPEEQTGQSAEPASPAEPTVAEAPVETQPAVNWREVVIGEDVDHGFFKQKKVPEVIESYKHAQLAMQEAQRERNEALKELEALRREREAEAAVRRVTGVQPQVAAPAADPYEERIQALWFENPSEAQRLIQERATENARRTAEEVFTSAEANRWAAEHQRSAQAAANTAIERVSQLYNITQQEAEFAVTGALPFLINRAASEGDGVWLAPENYIETVRLVRGNPAIAAPTIPMTPVPELSDPPGSKRAAAAQTRGSQPSPLTREEEQTRRALAGQFGLDPKDLIARGVNRAGGNRG